MRVTSEASYGRSGEEGPDMGASVASSGRSGEEGPA